MKKKNDENSRTKTKTKRTCNQVINMSVCQCRNQKFVCRLTETARLLRNVRNVFSRKSNTRVNMELELSREYINNPNKFLHYQTNINQIEMRVQSTDRTNENDQTLVALSQLEIEIFIFREKLSLYSMYLINY